MARISEKYNDSCLKMFSLLKLLMQGEADFKDVISIFADEDDGVISNSHVILNKYLNTLKIFGIKITKKKNKYYLLNMPFNIDFTADDVKAVELLKSASEIMVSDKSKDSLVKLIKDIEIRYSESAKIMAASNAGKTNIDLSFYYTKFREQILECERYCQEKQKLELIYLFNNQEDSIICSPKEIKYMNRKVCLSVFNQLTRQIIDIPIDNIKSIKQLPTVSSVNEDTTSVVYILKDRLADSYKLREWEHSNGRDKDGNLIVVNNNEDFDVLLGRLLKYGRNCTIVSPKYLRERMLDLINKAIENYNE